MDIDSTLLRSGLEIEGFKLFFFGVTCETDVGYCTFHSFHAETTRGFTGWSHLFISSPIKVGASWEMGTRKYEVQVKLRRGLRGTSPPST